MGVHVPIGARQALGVSIRRLAVRLRQVVLPAPRLLGGRGATAPVALVRHCRLGSLRGAKGSPVQPPLHAAVGYWKCPPFLLPISVIAVLSAILGRQATLAVPIRALTVAPTRDVAPRLLLAALATNGPTGRPEAAPKAVLPVVPSTSSEVLPFATGVLLGRAQGRPSTKALLATAARLPTTEASSAVPTATSAKVPVPDGPAIVRETGRGRRTLGAVAGTTSSTSKIPAIKVGESTQGAVRGRASVPETRPVARLGLATVPTVALVRLATVPTPRAEVPVVAVRPVVALPHSSFRCYRFKLHQLYLPVVQSL